MFQAMRSTAPARVEAASAAAALRPQPKIVSMLLRDSGLQVWEMWSVAVVVAVVGTVDAAAAAAAGMPADTTVGTVAVAAVGQIDGCCGRQAVMYILATGYEQAVGYAEC